MLYFYLPDSRLKDNQMKLEEKANHRSKVYEKVGRV